MDLALITYEATEPITLADAKVFLVVDHSEHDALISSLISAARESAEVFTNRSFLKKTYMLQLDGWPGTRSWYANTHGMVKLPRGPVRSIDSVKYKNDAGVWTTLDPSYYELNQFATPAYLLYIRELPAPGNFPNNVKITYQVGYDIDYTLPAPEDEPTPQYPFPEAVKNAIKMMVRTMYDHRDDFVIGASVANLPRTSQMLLRDYRIFEFV